MFRLSLILTLVLGFCERDETVFAYGAADKTWVFNVGSGDRPTLVFSENGQINGTAPCGAFTATQLQPYPWFEITDLSPPQDGCTHPQDRLFRQFLQAMTLAEVSDQILLLSDGEGRVMEFRALTPDG